jgi:hypothetical protein
VRFQRNPGEACRCTWARMQAGECGARQMLARTGGHSYVRAEGFASCLPLGDFWLQPSIYWSSEFLKDVEWLVGKQTQQLAGIRTVQGMTTLSAVGAGIAMHCGASMAWQLPSDVRPAANRYSSALCLARCACSSFPAARSLAGRCWVGWPSQARVACNTDFLTPRYLLVAAFAAPNVVSVAAALAGILGGLTHS